MVKINGIKVHGLKEAVGQYNYWIKTRGEAYIFFDEKDGEVWASKDNWRRYMHWHIVGYSPRHMCNVSKQKATMETVKAEIAWVTSAEYKQEVAKNEEEWAERQLQN